LGSWSCPVVSDALLEDDLNVLDVGDACSWVAIHHNEVSVLANSDGADLVLPAEEGRAVQGRNADRLQRRETRLDWQFNLALVAEAGDIAARRYRIGDFPAVGLSAARRLASVVRGRVAAGDDPQSEKRAKREAARRRRLGATVGGALATWLRDEKLGPLG